MDVEKSKRFITSLAKYLQTLCNDCVDFNDWVQVTGSLYVTIESGDIAQFVVNEELNKQDQNNFSVTSNSLQGLSDQADCDKQNAGDASCLLKATELTKNDNKEQCLLGTSSVFISTEDSENHSFSPAREEDISGSNGLSVYTSSTSRLEDKTQDNPAPFGLSLDEQRGMCIMYLLIGD